MGKFMNFVESFLKFSSMVFIFLIGVAIATVIGIVVKTAVKNTTSLSTAAADGIAAVSGILSFVILIGPIAFIAKNFLPVFLISVDLSDLGSGISNFVNP